MGSFLLDVGLVACGFAIGFAAAVAAIVLTIAVQYIIGKTLTVADEWERDNDE